MPEWAIKAIEYFDRGCYECAKVVTVDGLRGNLPDRSSSDNGSFCYPFTGSGQCLDQRNAKT